MHGKMLLTMALAALVGLAAAGCGAQTNVYTRYESDKWGLLPPDRVVVYDFAVTAAEVKENAGFLQGTINAAEDVTTDERERQIARGVQNVAAEEFVERLQKLGLRAERVPRGTPIPPKALAITGQFLSVDEGNKAQRMVIGFGKGEARVDIQIQLYELGLDSARSAQSQPSKLLEILTVADSGSMPGALVTGGAGAAAGAAAGVIVGTNMAIGAVKSYRSGMEQMTARSVEQAVDYLADYFRRRGWISPR